jgi:hypothetical protein
VVLRFGLRVLDISSDRSPLGGQPPTVPATVFGNVQGIHVLQEENLRYDKLTQLHITS